MRKIPGIIFLSCLFLAICSSAFVFAANEKLPAPSQPGATKPGQSKSEATGKVVETPIDKKLKNAAQYLQTKNYAKAREIYREIFLSATKGPVAEKALLGLGKADYYLKHYYEVILNMQRFFTLYKESEYVNDAYLLLGNTYLNMHKYKDAAQYFAKVGGNLTEKAIIGEATIALHLDDVAKADSLLSGLNRKTLDTDQGALYARAMIYSQKRMDKEAVSTINKILDPGLKELDIRVEKARIYFNAGKVKEAEKICRDIVKSPMSNSEGLDAKRVLLKIYETDGRTDDALKAALELAPYEPGDTFRLRIISLYDKKGDSGNALRYLSYLKDKAARSSEMEKRLKKLIDSRDPKAAEYLVKYSEYINTDSPLNVEAAKYLIASGKKKEGTGLLKKAKGIASGEAPLYLAELLISDGNYTEAKKILEGLKFDLRYGGRTAILLSGILEMEGNYGSAIEYLLKIMKIVNNAGVYAELGNLYWKTGDKGNALKYYVKAADMGDGLSAIRAGDCYYLAGDVKKATGYYSKAMNAGVKSAQDLQWAQYQYGKLTKNKDYIQKAQKGGGDIGAAASMLMGGK